MKILIAYDGSECADAALNDLLRAGLPTDVEAVVMSVAEIWLPPSTPSGVDTLTEPMSRHLAANLKKLNERNNNALEQVRLMAERACERLRQNFTTWTVSVEITSGSPAWETISKADAWKPDLVVVGSHGQSAIKRLVLGSVSQKVVTEARASVRVARGKAVVSSSPIRIVVAVDGSAGSSLAVDAVARRNWPSDTEVCAMIVEDPPVPLGGGFLETAATDELIEIDDEYSEWVRSTVETVVSKLRDAGLNAIPMIKFGDPKTVLVNEADSWRADSIFMGSTGVNAPVSRFLLGSVSAAVAARAHCSVELVRASQTSDAE